MWSPTHSLDRVTQLMAQMGDIETAHIAERNPGEGLWQQLTGVEWRHLCCVDLRHLWAALRTAVKRVRHKPRILTGCFAGAGL
jgi:hypothetical protein